jgi:phosphoglycolate phosphatase-like HAD superfamily hydrolase/ADP-ribose pyrophosphatase YjhB (NUDIX family)
VVRNIIFDWSGTLVDDLPAVWEATNHVLVQAGRPAMTLAQFRAEFCLPFARFYERHTPDLPMPQLEEWFHGRFREVQDSVVPLAHAREFLEFCSQQQVRTFVLSTVHQDHFAHQMARTGLAKFIDRPYVQILDKRHKIHEILTENGLAPAETIFVGDMEHDIETARHGGIGSCAVLTGYNSLAQLQAAEPDLIVEHLGEFREILLRTGMEFRSRTAPQTSVTESSDRRPVATVGALIFDGSGHVLMIRTHKWSNLWGIPGGKTEFGETSEAALRREIREETNLEITDIRFVLVQDCIHSREFYRDAHFVLLNYTCRGLEPAQVRLNEEAIEFRWVTLADAMALRLNEPTRILLEKVRMDHQAGRSGAEAGGKVTPSPAALTRSIG